jgi:hypothetical protein
MSALTISNLDSTVLELLSSEAERQGKSASELAGELIKRAMTPTNSCPTEKQRLPRDLTRLAGTWTKEEADEFDRAVASFGEIDEDLWK